MFVCVQFYDFCTVFIKLKSFYDIIQNNINDIKFCVFSKMLGQIVVLNSGSFITFNEKDKTAPEDCPNINTVPISVVSYYVSLRKSKPIRAFVNKQLVNDGANTYLEMLFSIYKTIGKKTLLSRTILNMTTEVINDKGYVYYDEFGLSIQSADELRVINEMFSWMGFYKHTLELFVELRNGEIIKIVK